MGVTLVAMFGGSGSLLAAGPLDVTDATEVVCNDTTIKLKLEEPKVGVVASGVANLRGWAAAPSGVERVSFYIDGEYRFDIPSGGKRGDVGNAYPNYPGSNYSGFSMAYNYSRLESGEHEFMVRATAVNGGCLDRTVTTSVARFDNSYYGNTYEMDLSEAEAEIVGDSLMIFGAQIGETAYDIEMGWHEAGQRLGVDNITAYGLDDLYDVDGTWIVEFTFNGDVGMEGGEIACTEGGTLSTEMAVTHDGSVVTIGSTDFEYTGNNPLFGMMFEGRQEESIHGGTRITDWELNMRSDKVTGSGIWEWSDGTSTCSGTTDVVGNKKP